MHAEFRLHGPVLVAAAAGVMLGVSALPAFVLGVFAGPMTREFGWSLGAYQAGTLVYTAGILACSPWVGSLCDRLGARAVACVGMPLSAVGIAAFSLVQPSVWTWYAAMGLAAVLSAGTVPAVWTRMVNSLFVERRGLALGIVLSGSGLFALLGTPFAQWLIDAVGWRAAWALLAVLPLLIATPLVLVLFRGDDRPAVPAGAAEGAAGGPVVGARPSEAGLSRGEALRGYRFWVLGAAFGLASIGVGAFNANLVPMLVAKGYAAQDAAGLVGVLGVSIAVGRLAIGYVIDRVWAPGVAAFVLSLPAIGTALMTADAVAPAAAVVAIALLGFAQGAEYDFLAFLTARYLGLRHYGVLYGLLIVPVAVCTAIGASGMGYLRDATGGFDAGLPWVGAAFVLGGAALLSLGRYPRDTRTSLA
jgi:predicted MFS family arabinose efflux permease